MRTSVTQFQLLVEFMERNGDLSKPTEGPQGRIVNIQRWAQLVELLNADSTGDTKPAEKWRKVWSDMKNNTKRKYARIYKDATGTGGGPASKVKLTDLEERVLYIIGSQAATGIPEIDEVGLPQDVIQPISASILQVHSEVLEDTENSFALWSQAGISASAQPAQLPEEIEIQVPNIEDTPPIPEAPQLPTPLPATPRRRRRLFQAMPSPTRRRTRPQTQSELARQAFVNSDNDLRHEEIELQVPNIEDTPPIPEAPQLPTPLPATPRRRRRLFQAMPLPTRRRTHPQTQSELARQAFVNSDNEWRIFQKKCEEERLRLRERELHQQDRWLDLFGQCIALGNRIVDTYQK